MKPKITQNGYKISRNSTTIKQTSVSASMESMKINPAKNRTD